MIAMHGCYYQSRLDVTDRRPRVKVGDFRSSSVRALKTMGMAPRTSRGEGKRDITE